MQKTLGYFVTWTTYGTWLQGEEKGYVKNGCVLVENPQLRGANIKALRGQPVKLYRKEKEIIRKAILSEAERHNQKIFAISVCSNHIHIVLEYCGKSIERIVGRYKAAGRIALQRNGFNRRVWTKGYYKQYCFDEGSLQKRIKYVNSHNKD